MRRGLRACRRRGALRRPHRATHCLSATWGVRICLPRLHGPFGGDAGAIAVRLAARQAVEASRRHPRFSGARCRVGVRQAAVQRDQFDDRRPASRPTTRCNIRPTPIPLSPRSPKVSPRNRRTSSSTRVRNREQTSVARRVMRRPCWSIDDVSGRRALGAILLDTRDQAEYTAGSPARCGQHRSAGPLRRMRRSGFPARPRHRPGRRCVAAGAGIARSASPGWASTGSVGQLDDLASVFTRSPRSGRDRCPLHSRAVARTAELRTRSAARGRAQPGRDGGRRRPRGA